MATELNGALASARTVRSAVEDIARNAGKIALSYFHSLASLPVEEKGHLDVVTIADREVERFLIASLGEMFPDDGIFGEEGGDVKGVSGRVWVVDPIDGTFNFVRGSRNWAISIGLFERHRPTFGVIYAPSSDLMLSGGDAFETLMNGRHVPPMPPLDLSRACIGIGIHPSVATEDRLELIRYLSDELKISFRCSGSATSSLLEVAMGQTDGYLSLGDATWDVMAGLPILKRLGVSHTIDWDRADLRAKLRYACGSEALLERVRPLLARVRGKGAKTEA